MPSVSVIMCIASSHFSTQKEITWQRYHWGLKIKFISVKQVCGISWSKNWNDPAECSKINEGQWSTNKLKCSLGCAVLEQHSSIPKQQSQHKDPNCFWDVAWSIYFTTPLLRLTALAGNWIQSCRVFLPVLFPAKRYKEYLKCLYCLI